MPMAAKVAQPVNCLIKGVVDSFMMMLLLSLSFHSRIGMAHTSSFGKLLSGGSLPLIGAKFRYLNWHTETAETIADAILAKLGKLPPSSEEIINTINSIMSNTVL